MGSEAAAELKKIKQKKSPVGLRSSYLMLKRSLELSQVGKRHHSSFESALGASVRRERAVVHRPTQFTLQHFNYLNER